MPELKTKVNPKDFDFESAPTEAGNPTEDLAAQLAELKVKDVVLIERASTGTALRVKAAIKRVTTRHAGFRFEMKRPDRNHWAVRRAA
jgi:hypothetical protein